MDFLTSGLALGVLLGLVFGVCLGAFGMWVYRKRVQAQRNTRTQKELEGNRVSTVAQVLHFTIQSAPDAVAVVDRKRNVVLSNPRAHELGLVHERNLNAEAWKMVERVFADQEPRQLNFLPPPRRSNRPVIAVAGQVQLLSLADDRFAVVYAADDSETVRMESARRDFVANVSHELKTPVGAISLLVETLMSVRDDEEAVEYFGSKLIVEVRRMNQMITELISLSKLQGAESLPDLEVLSIDKVIEDAIDRCRLAAEARNIEIVKDSRSGVMVKGDKGLLVTSVSNLLTNAINYSLEGSPVSISRDVQNDMVIIRVTDRGIGISQDDQKRVFERFFRVDKARSRNTGGTGLGLAIVKHVMANHGGSVSLWSRLGTGSTFTLELPRFEEGNAKNLPSGEIPVIPDKRRLDDAKAAGNTEVTSNKKATGDEERGREG